MGANLAENPHGRPDRWITDFNDMSLEGTSDYALQFKHVKATVKLERDTNRREVTRLNWWMYGEKRPALRKTLTKICLANSLFLEFLNGLYSFLHL